LMYDKLGRKLNNFLQAIIGGHKEPYHESPSVRELGAEYEYEYQPDLDLDDAWFIESHPLPDAPPTTPNE
jgi:hypothetical protein